MSQERGDIEGLLGEGMRLGGDDTSGPIVEIERDGHLGRVSLFGAHLIEWQPAGQDPVLWLSEGTVLDQRRGIRGGIPVCWPWFADHAEKTDWPSHGFARTTVWSVDWVDETDPQLPVYMTLPSLEAQRPFWPHASRPSVSYAIGDRLNIDLTTTNVDPHPIAFSQALHTYFAVGDIEQISISGLETCSYWDKTTGSDCAPTHGSIVIGAETDRIYHQPPGPIELRDEGLGRTITIEHEGVSSVIVWNPWIEKSARLGDMGPEDAYRGMVCIETGNVSPHDIRLQPGEAHTLRAMISVAKHSG